MDVPESQNPEPSSAGKKAWGWSQKMKLFSPEPPSPKPDPADIKGVVIQGRIWGFREGFL